MKHIDLPAAGDSARLRLTIDAMNALHEAFGDTYINDTLQRLNLMDPKCLKLCVEKMLVDADEGVTLARLVEKMTVSELAVAIADALWLAVHGKKLTDAADE